MNSTVTEKIQKTLARAGLGSRREIETWLQQGLISVNGKIATLGDRIKGDESIRVKGQLLDSKLLLNYRPRVLIYNKPEGEICTRTDPEGRKTVFASIPHLARGRWVMVGRLDINTSGLLLFTDQGELANLLMHPSSEVEREYAVRVLGEVTPEQLKELVTGVELEDGTAAFTTVTPAGGEGANQWYRVVLSEGRNREVRRLWEAVGVKVSRLIRTRYGVLSLPRELRQGKYSYLESVEVDQLCKSVGFDIVTAQGRRQQNSAYGAARKGQKRSPKNSFATARGGSKSRKS